MNYNSAEHQQYEEAIKEALDNFTLELYDLSVRYNTSVLGDMERRGVFGHTGPGKYITETLTSLEMIKMVNNG